MFFYINIKMINMFQIVCYLFCVHEQILRLFICACTLYLIDSADLCLKSGFPTSIVLCHLCRFLTVSLPSNSSFKLNKSGKFDIFHF